MSDLASAPQRRRPGAIGIVQLYTGFAALWILLSDRVVVWMFRDPVSLTVVNTLKGWFFVAITALLLHGLIQRLSGRAMDANLFERRSPARGVLAYVFSAAVTIGAAGLHTQIAAASDGRPIMMLFMLPILLSALLGGLGPGLLSTALASGITAWGWPYRGLLAPPPDPQSLLRWGFLLTNGVLLSVLSHLLHRTRQRADGERRLHALTLASIEDAVLTTNLEGRVMFLNPAAERLTEWSVADAVGRPLEELVPMLSEDTELPASLGFERVVRDGESLIHADARLLLTRHGHRTPIHSSLSPIRLGDGTIAGTVMVIGDEGERRLAQQAERRLQAEIQQMQKLESIGRLAGGVAHDFNNMLQVIGAHAELALELLPAGHPAHRDLLLIQKASGRSSDLTRQLLAFARQQTVVPRVLDLNDTVASMLKMLVRLIGEDIRLVWRPRSGLWPVFMDPTQVDQILANLAVNARDALAGQGSLDIATDQVVVEPTEAREHGVEPGEFVQLSVRDDGCGMPPEVLTHIFEPFFTTKAQGQGTGLGLSMVYGIVKQAGGFVLVHSEPGSGTTFHIHLPRCRGEVEPSALEVERTVPLGHGETILLVEDEPDLLEVAERLLLRLGYRVLKASRPHEALALAQAQRGSLDLLLTDVVMPEANGRDLSLQVRAIAPELPVLFMSGYTADIITRQGVLEPGQAHLAKPFDLQTLGEAVAAALGRSQRTRPPGEPTDGTSRPALPPQFPT